jgi:RNA polymerase sigma-70 factor (ECF subfamily)
MVIAFGHWLLAIGDWVLLGVVTEEPVPAGGEEAALAAALRRADPAAFETIVRTYGGRMLAVARRILRDEDEAREAVQEAFISAFRAREQFAGASKLSTWLHRIAVNAALMRLRARSRQREEPIEPWLPAFENGGHHLERFQAPVEPADERLARDETRALVRAAIDELPESYRVVLLLRDIDQLSTDETAGLLGITPNAVKLRLHRARMALRAKLWGTTRTST